MRKSVSSSLVLFRQINNITSTHRTPWKPIAICMNKLRYKNVLLDFAGIRFYNTTPENGVNPVKTNNYAETGILEESMVVQVTNHYCHTNSGDTYVHWTTRENEDDMEYSKEKLISQMNFLTEEDAKPFLKLPVKTLVHIYLTTKLDNKNGFCRNRLYYIAEKIKCSPSELSKHLAKRTFVYSLSFHWLESSLGTLLEMGVSSDRILRDLWVLKYKHETIRERLQRVKEMGIGTLYPWMVRCKQDIMNRYIEISQDTKNILGEVKSTQIYLADRLNTTPEAVAEICTRVPALKRIRATKVKHFVDFLISEGYQPKDIAEKPRVLAASPDTVKQRLEKLRKLGLNQINLNVLCKSQKDFKKYYESLKSFHMENK